MTDIKDSAVDQTEDVELDEQLEDAEYFQMAGAFFRTMAAWMFKELTQEEIDALAQLDLTAGTEDIETPELAEGFAGMERYLQTRSLNVRQDLAVEYARIFLGAGAGEKSCAVPFESVFTSVDGLLMQEARDEVLKVYTKYGITVDPSLNVPEDHLSFELQFVAHLCEKTAAFLKDGKDATKLMKVQVAFINEHILNWIDPLMAKVDECALSRFYPSVMKVIKGYCLEHRAALEEALEE